MTWFGGRKFTLGLAGIVGIVLMHLFGSLEPVAALAAVVAIVGTTQGSIAFVDRAKK